MEDEKKVRIKTWMLICMGAVALLIDGFQALLTFLLIGVAIGPVISVVSFFGFWVWFKILGVSFASNPKKMLAMGTGGLLEAMPIFSALPVLTLAVVSTALLTIAEDKGGIIGKAASVAQGKI